MVAETCYLKDLGSTNGTLVNGQPATQVQLRAGDHIRFGKVDAYFEYEVASAAQPLPRLEEAAARPAESSTRPADFANASPFQSRKVKKDPARTAVFAAAALAFLAFFVSLIALVGIVIVERSRLGDGAIDWNADIKPGPLQVGFDYSFIIPATGDR
jgi:pSer/pThr/pTyr-binding forkhead associated (FHA) protein